MRVNNLLILKVITHRKGLREHLNLWPTDPEADMLTTRPPRHSKYEFQQVGLYGSAQSVQQKLCRTPLLCRCCYSPTEFKHKVI